MTLTTPKSGAERTRTYRIRKQSHALAADSEAASAFMTVNDFQSSVSFDASVFWSLIEGEGTETAEYQAEREETWQEAYNEAYNEAYDEAYNEAYNSLIADEDEAAKEEAQQSADEVAKDEAHEVAKDEAHEAAKEAADEAVKEWEASVEDYAGTCVEYPLAVLLEAQRQAQTI